MKKTGLTLFMIIWFQSIQCLGSTNFLPTLFLTYPQISGTQLGDCTTCHTIDKWQRNAFGRDLQEYLRTHYDGPEEDPQRRVYTMTFIASGLEAIEDLDSDGDGVSNIEELENLTFPGDELDY